MYAHRGSALADVLSTYKRAQLKQSATVTAPRGRRSAARRPAHARNAATPMPSAAHR